MVRIVTTEPVGDSALTVYYKTADGVLRERMLFRADEAKLSLAEAGRPGRLMRRVMALSWLPRPTAFTWRTCLTP